MIKLWYWLFKLSKKKIKRNYMDAYRHDRECPNCKVWTSEVGGVISLNYQESTKQEIMECKQCGYKSVWNTYAMVPMLEEQQPPHTPKVLN